MLPDFGFPDVDPGFFLILDFDLSEAVLVVLLCLSEEAAFVGKAGCGVGRAGCGSGPITSGRVSELEVGLELRGWDTGSALRQGAIGIESMGIGERLVDARSWVAQRVSDDCLAIVWLRVSSMESSCRSRLRSSRLSVVVEAESKLEVIVG